MEGLSLSLHLMTETITYKRDDLVRIKDGARGSAARELSGSTLLVIAHDVDGYRGGVVSVKRVTGEGARRRIYADYVEPA